MKIRRFNGSSWVQEYPEVNVDNIVASNSSDKGSGNYLRGDGKWDAPLYYVVGNTTGTAGTWTGTISGLTAYYDGLTIRYKQGIAGATNVYLNINSLGDKQIYRYGGARLTTHWPVGTISTLTYNSSDNRFYATPDYNSTDDYRIRWQNDVAIGAYIHGYQLLAEGTDGAFYPVTEGGSTGNTNTVSTADLRIGGTLLAYDSGTDIAAGGTTSGYEIYEGINSSTMEYWNNRDSGWATDMAPIYLVGIDNGDGSYNLDNTSYTSFLTQTIPTSDDGKIYIHIGWMNDTYDSWRLEVVNQPYVYKDGAFQLYSGYATYAENANKLDGINSTQFLRSDTADTATGDITFTGNIVADGQIRSNTPANNIAPINVKSDGEGQAIHIEETGSGAESWQLGVDTAGNLNFMNSGSGTPSIRFMDNDNVGIGVESPSEKLDVAGNISANSGRAVLRDNSLENHATNANSDIAVNYFGYATGTTQFRDFNVFNGKEQLIASFDGSTSRVGIGTSSPSYGLDVHADGGQIRAYGTTAKVWAEASDAGQASFELKNTEGHFRFITDGDAFQLWHQTGGTERMAIAANGNVTFNGGQQQLNANGNIVADGDLYLNNDRDNVDTNIYFGDQASTTAHRLYFDTSAQVFRFSSPLIMDSGTEIDGISTFQATGTTSGSGTSGGFTAQTSVTGATSLSASYAYVYRLTTNGTGTNSGATYVIDYNPDNSTWNARAVALSGTTSNHPLLEVSSNVVNIYINHTSAYTIRYSVTRYNLGDSDGTWDMLGELTQWQRNATTLYYNDGDVGIGTALPSDKLEVVGNIRANRFTDRTNTSYYVDPASTSVLYALTVGGNDVLTTASEGSGNGLDADTVDGKHIWSGNVWNRIPVVFSDGVMEVGRYIDFHNTSGDTSDFAVRLDTDGTSGLRINGSKIWTSGNDGNGSGLSADNLRGYVPQESASVNSIAKRDGNGDLKVNDLIIEHNGTGTAADSHAVRFTARAANVDYTKDLIMDDEGDLLFNGNALATEAYVTANAGGGSGTLDFAQLGSVTVPYSTSTTSMSISPSNGLDSIIAIEVQVFSNASPATWTGPLDALSASSTYKAGIWGGSTQYANFYRNSTGTSITFSGAPSANIYNARVYEIKVV